MDTLFYFYFMIDPVIFADFTPLGNSPRAPKAKFFCTPPKKILLSIRQVKKQIP
jgi:hypothetical protein